MHSCGVSCGDSRGHAFNRTGAGLSPEQAKKQAPLTRRGLVLLGAWRSAELDLRGVSRRRWRSPARPSSPTAGTVPSAVTAWTP
ncbi:hypothetical protein MRX96_004429 [Rhipicephalus microplus]